MLKLNRRKLLTIAALGTIGLWLAASAMVAWSHTRRRHEPFPEPPPKVAWANMEGCRLKTSDDEEIGGWLVRGDRRKGCAVLLHGNGDSRREMLPVMRLLAEEKYSVLAISLRAHGDSTGETNDLGWSSRRDVAAAVAFLQTECPGQPIYIVGRSLGAAAAIFAAKELKGNVAGYFLEQPYKDLKSAVWCRLQHRLPPGANWVAYLGMRLWAPLFLSCDPDEISPIEHIRDIPEDVPIVILAGSADRHAQLDDVKELFSQAQSHATLVVFEGAQHVALDSANPELYRTSLLDLLGRKPKADGQ